jgi:gamma-glutamyltranspeptidase / glutathione hydrolase
LQNIPDWEQPYPSRRSPVCARNIVATSQPLAVQAGLQALRAGGNAVDAAVAAAVTLTVVEPVMNGIGSDAFAMVWNGQRLYALNASGRAPAAWTPERFASRKSMPTEGWDAVTVPGAVSAWAGLWKRFGRRPFASLFEDAIRYAEEGFVVSPIVARQWALQVERLRDRQGFASAFMPNGRAPQAGGLFRFPDQAATLQRIAESEGRDFYEGETASRLVSHSAANGGALTAEDLAIHTVDWVEPLTRHYRGVAVAELPPNGQGIAVLMALGVLENFEMPARDVDTVASIHLQVEAMKLAFADVYRHVSDPAGMHVSTDTLLDDSYLRGRAGMIDPHRASTFGPGLLPEPGTVYLTTADAAGCMVSYIQSNYMGFGSGVVVPGTGVSLQNRGAAFSLRPDHPNLVAGGRRPFHTIIPGFALAEGAPLMSFGVMGGDMQAQGHLQIVVRTVDYRQNPQAAADAPRWKLTADGRLLVEESFGARVLAALAERGHVVVPMPAGSLEFGAAQLIRSLEAGYAAGSEPRRDGQAGGF